MQVPVGRRVRHGVLAAAVAGLGLATTAPAVATSTGAASSTVGKPAGVATAPAGFKSQSTSWLDKQHGFLLGSAPCGSRTCTDVLGTSDGGSTWTLLGHPLARIVDAGQNHPGITEVRFGTPMSGWAFAPLLRHTADGGATWTKEPIPGGGGQVLALATDADGSWAVVSPCTWGHFGACRKQPLTLWRTAKPEGATWRQVRVTLPYSFAASLGAFANSVYVVDPQLELGGPDVLLASTDGKTFDNRTAPCDHTQDIQLIQAVPMSATNVALLCDGNPGFSKAVKSVYTSTDTGTTDTYRGTMGLEGIQAQLAASPSGNLAVAASSDGSFIYINDSKKGQTWEMPVAQGDGGLGWNDIEYVTNKEAYVVYSPVSQFDRLGQLWVTHDAGHTWQNVSP